MQTLSHLKDSFYLPGSKAVLCIIENLFTALPIKNEDSTPSTYNDEVHPGVLTGFHALHMLQG